MIRKLYNWMFELAKSKHATKALAGFSFAESSFFPIPPDVLLIPMVLANRAKWFKYALICTIASILGAYLGYAIGSLGYEFIGKPILAFYGKEDLFVRMQDWFDKWGGWGLLFAAITPFPYKVLTISSGFAGLNILMFTLVSIVGRGFRFFLVSWLLFKFGEPIQTFIEKRLNLLFVVGMVLLVGGFALLKYVG